MSPTDGSHGGAARPGASRGQDLDDAEKGMFDSTPSLPVLSYMPSTDSFEKPHPVLHLETGFAPFSPIRSGSPIHEGITPFSSVLVLQLSWPKGYTPRDDKPAPVEVVVKKPGAGKPKIGRWILFLLWFNTYRKFFTFVTLLNLTGIVMAALGRFPYAENHLGALVLGNLLCAILMRNELFLRFLYMVAIYGLRAVRLGPPPLSLGDDKLTRTQWAPVPIKLAATSVLQHVGGIHSGCALSGAAYVAPALPLDLGAETNTPAVGGWCIR